jgi:hypothetical protein
MVTAGLLLLGAAALPAQNLKADIPFDFYIGDTKLAAGTYQLLNGSELQASSYWRFRSATSGRSTMAFMPIPVTTDSVQVTQPSLVFKCAQGECELYEIWSLHNRSKVRAPKSKRFQGINPEIATIAMTNGM